MKTLIGLLMCLLLCSCTGVVYDSYYPAPPPVVVYRTQPVVIHRAPARFPDRMPHRPTPHYPSHHGGRR